jgi:hypothetical protein
MSHLQNIEHYTVKISDYPTTYRQSVRISTLYRRNIRQSNIVPSKYQNIEHHTVKISGLSNITQPKYQNIEYFTVKIYGLYNIVPSKYQNIEHYSYTVKIADYPTSYHQNIRITDVIPSNYRTIQHRTAKISEYRTFRVKI